MGRLYIFAVGGTGARIMRSLTMLMSAGELADYEVVPILIDFDVDNGDLVQTHKLMQMYKYVHEKSYDSGAFLHHDGFFCSPLRPIMDIPHNNAVGNNSFVLEMPTFHYNMHVSDLLGFPNLMGNEYKFKLLLEALLTTDTDGELNQDLCVGFKGHAKVARLGYAALRIQDTIEFRTFLNIIEPNSDKVVVVGSTFGGTGSVGVFEILRQLRSGHHIPINNIATVLIEPYFLPIPDPAMGHMDYCSVFKKRSKEFLKFYSDSGLADFVKTTYKIGMDGFVIYESAIGGHTQRNIAHSVELLSAMAICDYTQTGQQGLYEYKLGQLNLQFGHDGIERRDFYHLPDGLRMYEALSILLLAARFYREYSSGNHKVISSRFYKEMQRHAPIDLSFGNTLNDIMDSYLRWLEELSCGISDRFGLALFYVNNPLDRTIRDRRYVHHGLFFHLFAYDIIDDIIEKMNNHYHSLRHETIASEQILLRLLSESSRSIFQQFQ